VFKTWQIFVFSLVPLALVFIGVIGGSIHGVDSAREVFPTPPPAPPPSSSGPSSGPSTATGQITLAARNLAFDKRTLAAPANRQVTLRFDNQDAGQLHNFALYTDNRASTRIFVSEFTTGPATRDFSFTSPAPGNYFYRCDTHPDQMTGTFTAR
jgi:hypothetical protein